MSFLLMGIVIAAIGFLMLRGVIQSLHTGISGDRGGEVYREKSFFYFWLITFAYLFSALFISSAGLLSVFVGAKDLIGGLRGG